jgi:hypothetical protein
MNQHADVPQIPSDLIDIELAIHSSVAVLITAPPDDALSIARVIADQRGWSEDLLVCDFGPRGRQRRPDGTEQPPLERARILLLREVHTLTPSQQARLMELFEADDPGPRPRIIASSSVALFDRVRQGTFDARLYYRLNGIHLTTPAGAGGGLAGAIM